MCARREFFSFMNRCLWTKMAWKREIEDPAWPMWMRIAWVSRPHQLVMLASSSAAIWARWSATNGQIRTQVRDFASSETTCTQLVTMKSPLLRPAYQLAATAKESVPHALFRSCLSIKQVETAEEVLTTRNPRSKNAEPWRDHSPPWSTLIEVNIHIVNKVSIEIRIWWPDVDCSRLVYSVHVRADPVSGLRNQFG